MVNKTSFLKVLGNSPMNKVFDFLIENDRETWSMNEISENAHVGYSTLKKLLPKMLLFDLISVKKQVGKIKFYGLDKDNDVVKQIYKLYDKINRKEIENLINSEASSDNIPVPLETR